MPIKSIKIKNFRSHKDTHIEFDPNVNIIIGENDSGKTNILRVLKWIVDNRPSGDDMRSFWEGDTVAKLDVDNIIIERIRTNSENLYKMNGEVYKAFGQGVPEQIAKFLNMNPNNISFQMDGPFLLGLSAADVAKHYNKIIKLDIIDQVVSNINKILKEEETNLKFSKISLKEEQDKLKIFDWLDDAEINIRYLEKIEVKINNLKKGIESLETLSLKLVRLSEKHDLINRVLINESKVNELIQLDKTIQNEFDKYKNLAQLKDKLKLLVEKQNKISLILKHNEAVNNLISDCKLIEDKKQDLNKLTQLCSQLQNLRERKIKILKKLKFENIILQLEKKKNEIEDEKHKLEKLQNLSEKLNELLTRNKNLSIKIVQLEGEYKQNLPEICPILEIKCSKLENAKVKK